MRGYGRQHRRWNRRNPQPLLLVPDEPLTVIAVATIGRALFRYRSELAPLTTAATLLLAGALLHHTHPSAWPFIAVLTVAAALAAGLRGLPWGISTGYAPMRDYSSIPMATAGLFSPSRGLRYGGQIPGYAPQYGIATENQAGNPDVQNAGQAEALPSVSDGFTQDGKLPLLIAVLALSGVSAGLVRTWVLRRMAATS